MVYLSFTPKFLQQIFPDLVWRIETSNKEIYLSFDDGPIPEVTPWILEQLEQFHAKASFFCVGQNIERHPEIFAQIIRAGHTVGSHSFNHLSGWGTDNLEYILNVRKGARACGSNLYRPPYGRLKPSQTRILKHHYKIIMWDVLSGDFDPDLSAEACYQNVIRNTLPGSIVVFHDSIKSKTKLKFVLPKVLEYFSEKGYNFKALNESELLKTNHSKKVYSELAL